MDKFALISKSSEEDWEDVVEEDDGEDDMVYTFEGEEFTRSDIEAILETAVNWNLMSDLTLPTTLSFRKKILS